MVSRAIPQSKGNLDACLERMERGRAFRQELMNGESSSAVPYSTALIDAVNLFDELGIEYALVGGVASLFYGRARYTEDVDFVCASGHQEILKANPQVMRQYHFDPNCTWKLYHGSGTEIDIWKDEHCDEIVKRASEAEVRGRKIKIAEPHDLIAMKLRAGRLQDDYDVSEILKGTAIDDEVVRQRVDAAQFQHYLEIKSRTR